MFLLFCVFLRTLSPVSDLTLKNLTFKLVMLISLTNATRVQTIQLLDIQNMEIHKSQYIFCIEGLVKQSRPGYKNPPVVLKAYRLIVDSVYIPY